MLTRLWLIFFFGGTIFLLWILTKGFRPHQGLHGVLEAICVGALLCMGLSLLAKPLGIHFPSGPLPSVFAGTLGLPGAVLAFWVGSGL